MDRETQAGMNRGRRTAPELYLPIWLLVMDGYTATQAIRGLPDKELAGIPIIAMTANAFQEDIRKAAEVGMNGHIAKPLDIPDMRATLQRVLKHNGSADER